MDYFFLPRGKPRCRVSKNVCSEQPATLVSYYLIRAIEPAPELGGYTCATTETDAPKKDNEVCSRKISIKVGVSASITARAQKMRAHARHINSEPPFLQSWIRPCMYI